MRPLVRLGSCCIRDNALQFGPRPNVPNDRRLSAILSRFRDLALLAVGTVMPWTDSAAHFPSPPPCKKSKTPARFGQGLQGLRTYIRPSCPRSDVHPAFLSSVGWLSGRYDEIATGRRPRRGNGLNPTVLR